MDRDERGGSRAPARGERLPRRRPRAPEGPRGRALLEIKSRVEETDISVPVRKGAWWYFERTREGLNYPISARVPTVGDDLTPPVIDPETTFDGEQVILDENLEAGGHDFLSVGVLALSPDESWVAVGTDFDGDERHHVTVRPLAGQEPVADDDRRRLLRLRVGQRQPALLLHPRRRRHATLAALAPRARHRERRRRPRLPRGRRAVSTCRSGAAATIGRSS